MTTDDREPVFVITTENGDDLIVGFGITHGEPGSIASLVLQRTPKFEHLLPPEDRGVAVSYELDPADARQFLQSISINGTDVNVITNAQIYRLDISQVEAEDVEDTIAVLKRMYEYGGFALRLR